MRSADTDVDYFLEGRGLVVVCLPNLTLLCMSARGRVEGCIYGEGDGETFNSWAAFRFGFGLWAWVGSFLLF